MGKTVVSGKDTGAPAARWLVVLRLVAWFAATALVCTALIVWRDPAFGFVEMPALGAAQIALNAVPPLLFALLVFCATGRALAATWLALLALWAIYLINQLKLLELGTPLMPGDALLLSNLGDHGGLLLTRYLPLDARHVIEAVVAVAILALLLWRERPPIGWRSRVAIASLSLLLTATLLGGMRPWPSLYGVSGNFNAWVPPQHARRFGLFAHLLRYRWETAGALPDPDYSAAERLLARHRDTLPEAASLVEPPDIVVLQSESFFDAARLRGIEDADVLPNYRALSEISRHGDLWVPTYGGGTIRTEFEVLTGIAMRYFPSTQYPYFRLTATPLQSIASVLAAEGYRTLAIHPHDRAFWNRASTFENLGFRAFDAEEQFDQAPREGFYASDAALVDRVLARLDDADGPTFVFAISMENHGPYDHYPNADNARRDAEPAPIALSASAKQTLRGYLYHAENADRELGRLADALRARSRRTLLLFYGDHLPGLPDVYRETGFDDGAAANEEPVPWLLFDTADAARRERIDTASFYLPALLLHVAGVHETYFSLLDAMRRQDRVGMHWIPSENEGLGALMQLRQRGGFEALASGFVEAPVSTSAPVSPQ
jgi:phosphoglycerol transferase MdoB-like AlkP superfamily enzyme